MSLSRFQGAGNCRPALADSLLAGAIPPDIPTEHFHRGEGRGTVPPGDEKHQGLREHGARAGSETLSAPLVFSLVRFFGNHYGSIGPVRHILLVAEIVFAHARPFLGRIRGIIVGRRGNHFALRYLRAFVN